MDMPYDLRDAIGSRAEAYKLNQLKSAASLMTERYRQESGAGKHLVTKDVETAAYAVVRMPATYGAISEALGKALACVDEEIAFSDVLDVGAGTGTASWVVRELLGEGLSYTCIERERSMVNYAKDLMQIDPELSRARWLLQDFAEGRDIPEADLVIASYSLNELAESDRERLVKLLWQNTGKMLLLVEPGTPEGFRQLRRAREILQQEQAVIAAPCPKNEACPMQQEDWCHFTARVSRSKLHKAIKEADVPYEDEKFCFLAAVRGEAYPVSARILRHPIKESGRIGLVLCTEAGIANQSITKKHKSFKGARKASAGDAFSCR